ncbi:MAG TPA: tripartite tricarboxylate transporter substrate binding protein [Microvirga sp.]|jgi:putative tricarboxylic transport membrane protein|nr:tripartite tricarboxylate transporter substrate binding protein [Microvirga sp.]
MTKFGLSRRTLFAALASAALCGTATTAWAAPYPERDVTIIVQASAGGGSDIFARTITNIIEKKKLVPTKVIVENRPGGGGAVGYNFVAQRPGNPYFIGTVAGSFFTVPLLNNSPVNYKEFTPLAAMAADPYVLTVRADTGIKTLKDLSAKGTVRVGTTGVVTDPALIAAMLDEKLGLKTRVIPYGGDGEVLSALLGGHIDVQIGNPSEILSQIRAGKLTPLATTSAQRLSQLPDVPTFKEQGVDIEFTQMRALAMPKNVPAEAVKFWEGVLQEVANSAEWKEYVASNNSVPLFMGSEELGKAMPKYHSMYEDFMKKVNAIK